MREAGGEVYAVTSEPHSLAMNAESDWKTGMQHIGDPHHEIAGACAERGWLQLFTNDWGDSGLTDWASHPKGYFQPGVLALSKQGRVLYRWRSRPNRKNIGGAVGRPLPEHAWKEIKTALDQGPDAPDAKHDDNATLDRRPAPWPIFVGLLFANGWFIRPRPFPNRPGKNDIQKRIRMALLRLVLFVAAWMAAAILLPPLTVGIALAVYAAVAAPGIIWVHKRFQNVAPGQEPAEIQ